MSKAKQSKSLAQQIAEQREKAQARAQVALEMQRGELIARGFDPSEVSALPAHVVADTLAAIGARTKTRIKIESEHSAQTTFARELQETADAKALRQVRAQLRAQKSERDALDDLARHRATVARDVREASKAESDANEADVAIAS